MFRTYSTKHSYCRRSSFRKCCQYEHQLSASFSVSERSRLFTLRSITGYSTLQSLRGAAQEKLKQPKSTNSTRKSRNINKLQPRLTALCMRVSNRLPLSSWRQCKLTLSFPDYKLNWTNWYFYQMILLWCQGYQKDHKHTITKSK